MTRPAGLILTVVVACGAPPERPGPGADRTLPDSAPADSLALTAPGGIEVWYTLSRPGRAPDGRACTDRGLEIRRGTVRIPVPLLYTGSAPELVNDTTIRARLSRDCAPAERYLVNLRTGRPTPER